MAVTRKHKAGMHTFATGAKRSSTMPRFDLIPRGAYERIADRFTGRFVGEEPTGGALKYGECNWEKGLATTDTVNHTLQHIINWMDTFRESLKRHKGDMEKVRKDMQAHTAKDDDLAGAVFGLIVLMYQEQTGMFHDDRFKVFSE